MRALLRSPQTSDPVTTSGTVQDLCGLAVVVVLIAIAVTVLP